MAWNVCLQDGCGELTEAASKRCPAHERRSPSSAVASKAGWIQARNRALRRDGHRCTFCGSTEDLEVHHVIPVAEGGDYLDVANLVTTCRACHPRARAVPVSDNAQRRREHESLVDARLREQSQQRQREQRAPQGSQTGRRSGLLFRD